MYKTDIVCRLLCTLADTDHHGLDTVCQIYNTFIMSNLTMLLRFQFRFFFTSKENRNCKNYGFLMGFFRFYLLTSFYLFFKFILIRKEGEEKERKRKAYSHSI